MINNSEKTFYHFSVDDIIESLIEITDRKIGVFEHPLFLFLKELHDEFNINVDLYLFFQKEIDGKLRTLSEVSSSLKETLENNPWIRFGPHGLQYETMPYAQTPREQIEIFDKIYKEIYRFAGGKNLSKWVRLHNFSESYELKEYFLKFGVEALFTTDKDWITTRMPDTANKSLKSNGFAEHKGFKFIRSHIRTENLANDEVQEEERIRLIKHYLDEQNHFCFFTHEYELVRNDVKHITKELIKELHNRKVPSY